MHSFTREQLLDFIFFAVKARNTATARMVFEEFEANNPGNTNIRCEDLTAYLTYLTAHNFLYIDHEKNYRIRPDLSRFKGFVFLSNKRKRNAYTLAGVSVVAVLLSLLIAFVF